MCRTSGRRCLQTWEWRHAVPPAVLDRMANRPRAPMPTRRSGHRRKRDLILGAGSVSPLAWPSVVRDAVAALAGRKVRAGQKRSGRSMTKPSATMSGGGRDDPRRRQRREHDGRHALEGPQQPQGGVLCGAEAEWPSVGPREAQRRSCGPARGSRRARRRRPRRPARRPDLDHPIRPYPLPLSPTDWEQIGNNLGPTTPTRLQCYRTSLRTASHGEVGNCSVNPTRFQCAVTLDAPG